MNDDDKNFPKIASLVECRQILGDEFYEKCMKAEFHVLSHWSDEAWVGTQWRMMRAIEFIKEYRFDEQHRGNST